jgi:hypothetical protein
MKTAAAPFEFVTASYLTRINNQKASNLSDLASGIQQASDASIFYHTFQSLGRHHFLSEFSNDFAQWALASLNRPALAERLAGIDIRDYNSLAELRSDLLRMVAEYADSHPREAQQSAFEPFFFTEAVEVTVPLELEARNLAEFRDGLQRLSHSSMYYHFIASRLRLHLGTNDFSNWFTKELEEPELARRANRIDIYINTLDSVREKLTAIVDGALNQ